MESNYRRFLVSDCEGPITLNDNAFELSSHFIDDGDKFFEIISKYDDILVEKVKKPGYNAGGTLKLILPFLKAYGVTNDHIKNFSQDNVLLVPGALDTLQYLYCIMPTFIISTSYQHYIQAVCDSTGFPYENTYSTQLDIDKYKLSSEEKINLKKLKDEIINNPEFENLNRIFWEELTQMNINKIVEDVNPLGGVGKEKALKNIMSRFKFNASDLIYVGDSITDAQPLRFAHNGKGLAVSFNGNEYAVKEAEIVIMADNTLIISIIADLFNKIGRKGVLEFVDAFNNDQNLALYNYPLDPQLTLKFPHMNNLRIEILTSDNIKELEEESLKYRKKVRGDSIGGLG